MNQISNVAQKLTKSKFRTVITLVLVFQILLATHVGSEVDTSITMSLLGAPKEGGSAIGIAINNNGVMTGSTNVNGFNGGFIYYPDTGFMALPSLEKGNVYPQDINDNNQVVGYGFNSDFRQRAFIWDQENGIQDLGVIYNSYWSYSFATAINNLGQVVGYGITESGIVHAFLWDSINGMQDLGSILGTSYSYATDINDNGAIVGYAQAENSFFVHAFLLDPISGVTDLGHLSDFDGFSQAYRVNNNNQVVGVSRANEYRQRAFVWDEENGMQDISPITTTNEPRDLTIAFDINDDGQAIGYIRSRSVGEFGFIWDASQGTRQLPTTENGDIVSTQARGINNNGVIVGSAFLSSLNTWYLATWETLSPEGIVNNVIDSVLQLNLPSGTKNALTTSVTSALVSLEKGNINAASNKLYAFNNKVTALIYSGRIDADVGQGLIDDITTVISMINEV